MKGGGPRLLCVALLCAGLAGCVAPPAAAPEVGPASAAPTDTGTGLRTPQEAPAKADTSLGIVPPPVTGPALPPTLAEPAQGPGGVLLGSGIASWYADKFQGRLTASGERFDNGEFTAAHPTLPFGTHVCVRSLVNGRAVVVRINDRGPFTPGRIIDLSQAAAQELGMMGLGIKPVELWRLSSDADACPDAAPQNDDLAARIQAAGASSAAPATKARPRQRVLRRKAAPRRPPRKR